MKSFKVILKRGFKTGVVNDTAEFNINIEAEDIKRAYLIAETGWAIAINAWNNDQSYSETLRFIEMEAKLMGGYRNQIHEAYNKCIEFIAHPEMF